MDIKTYKCVFMIKHKNKYLCEYTQNIAKRQGKIVNLIKLLSILPILTSNISTQSI